MNILLILLGWGVLAVLLYNTFEHIKEAGHLSKIIPKDKAGIATALPKDEMTPGQVAFFRYTEFIKVGNVFAASLMNLDTKNAIDFIYKGNEYNLSNAFIKVNRENKATLVAEEKPIYQFLLECVDKFKNADDSISLNMLQKIISNSPNRISHLKKDITNSIKNSLMSYNRDSLSKMKKSIIGIAVYFILIMICLRFFGLRFDIFTLEFWIEALSIFNFAHLIRVILRTNIFDQQGTEDRVKIIGFESYLLDFEKYDLPEISIWNYYMKYAMALGALERVLPKVESIYGNIINSEIEENYRIASNIMKCDFPKAFALTYVV